LVKATLKLRLLSGETPKLSELLRFFSVWPGNPDLQATPENATKLLI